MDKKTLIIGIAALVVVVVIVAIMNLPKNPAEGLPQAMDANQPAPGSMQGASDDAVTYTFSEESKIGFTGSKVTGSHDGGFNSFEGSFTMEGDQPVGDDNQIIIHTDSIWSDNEKLTGHLKSADFFEVETYPTSTFKLTSAKKEGDDGSYTVTGDFTLHGVTKSIQFPVTLTKEEDNLRLKADFVIKRKDYGIVYPGKPDDLIRDDVVIRLDMVAVPEA